MITIIINGIEWNVFFVDKTHRTLINDEGEQNAYGVTHFRTCEIYLDSGLNYNLFKQIVMHELVHALAFSYGESIEIESEEKICDFIAAHFDELKTLRKSVLKSI